MAQLGLLTYLDGPKQMLALENKAIDAAWAGEPWGAIAEAKAVGVRFKTPDRVKGTEEVQISMVMYSGKFIAEKRGLAQRFMNAYVKGCKYYSERGMKDEEVLQVLEKYIKIPAATLKASIPVYIDKDGRINVKSVEEMQDWLYNNGYMKEKAPMDKIIDLSFLK